MARTAILAIKIISDASQAGKGMDKAAGGVSKWEAGLAKADGAAKITLGAIAAVSAASFKAASDLQQASGAVESVFGAAAPQVMSLAAAAAQSVGLAQADYASLASVLGAQLKNLGVSQDQLAGTTDSLITTGADLAATFGGSTADAVEALSAAFRGETDPIEKYGISIKQADVNAKLAAQGQDKLTGSAKKQAETQARMALIMEQSASAHGQFARESDTAAGAQQRAAAEAKNAAAAFGTALLPVVAQLAGVLGTVAGFVQRNIAVIQVLAGVVAGLAGAIIAVNAAVKAYQAIQTAMAIATKLAAAAQWLLNIALSANPIGIIIIAVIALVAGLVLLYRKSAAFRAIVAAVTSAAVAGFNAVVNAVKIAWQWIGQKLAQAGRMAQAAIAAAAGIIRAALSAVRAVVNAVSGAFRAAANAGRSAFAAVANVVRTLIAIHNQLIGIVRGALAAAFRSVGNVARAAFASVASSMRVIVSAARNIAQGVASAFRAAFDKVAGYARRAADMAMAPFRALHSLVTSVLNAIGRIHFPSPPSWLNKTIKGPTVSTSVAAMPGLGPSTRAGSTVVTSRPQSAPLIVVNGALDPERVARQIQGVLGGAARRRRGVVRPLRAGAL